MNLARSDNSFNLSTVPAFLAKLWTLVNDPSTDELIGWDDSGRSFHVLEQLRFAKEILPLYFKHNNIASFVRQLNLYGFRKVVNNEVGNLKLDNDDMEFSHPYFMRGQETLLEFIKRKVPASRGGGNVGEDGIDGSTGVRQDARAVLDEVHEVKSRQDNMTVKLENLKLENEVLWREVASLRQMHMKQQHIVSKLIRFLVSVVGNASQKPTLSGGIKRKAPLMIGAAGSSTGPPAKIPVREHTSDKTYEVQSPQTSNEYSPNPVRTGVTIDDVSDLLNTSDFITSDFTYVTAPDSMEPLAILDTQYPSALELTDVLEDSEIVPLVEPNEVLPSPKTSLDERASTTATPAASVPVPSTARTSMSEMSTGKSTLAITDTRPTRNDLTSHIDLTHSQLSGLRDLLTGSPQINIDPSMLMELFGYLDTSMPPVGVDDNTLDSDVDLLTNCQTKSDTKNSTAGSEVVQYVPADDLSTLYDILSPSQMFLNDSDIGFTSPLATPAPTDVQTNPASRNGRHPHSDSVMQDVD